MLKHHLRACKEIFGYLWPLPFLVLYFVLITTYKLPWYWAMLPLVCAFLYCFYQLYRIAYRRSRDGVWP